MPKGMKKDDILKGMYLFREINNKGKTKVQLLGSGAILNEVMKAAEILSSDFGIDSDIWSVTSFNELRKDAIEIERKNLLNPDKKPEKTYIEKCFEKKTGPFIAATDYIRTLSEGIRNYIPGTYVTLGTDGFGRSDTRKNLRKFFEINKEFIVYSTLSTLVKEQKIASKVATDAMKKYNIDPKKPIPTKL
jgi:pyruvate dehydrogenase E1 component